MKFVFSKMPRNQRVGRSNADFIIKKNSSNSPPLLSFTQPFVITNLFEKIFETRETLNINVIKKHKK